LEAEKTRIAGGYKKMMKYSYAERGFYHRQLAPYYELFGRDSVHVVILEEFIKDIPRQMSRVEEFLGIPQYGEYAMPGRTNTGYLPKKRWIAFIKRRLVRPVRGIYNKITPGKIREKVRSATDEGRMPMEIMPEDIRSELMDLYRNDIKSLEKLLQRDLSIWS
jgi:hypothetical protein